MKAITTILVLLCCLAGHGRAEDLYTRSYHAPEILRAGTWVDSFGGGVVVTGLDEELRKMGVELVEGSSVTVSDDRKLVLRATLLDHEILESILVARQNAGPKQVHIFHEAIEVEKRDFGKWLLKHRMHGDADELRDTLQDWILEERARVYHLTELTAQSGERAKVEAAESYDYPTEFDPPSVPSDVTLSGDATAPVTGVQVATLDTRQVGTVLEVDPVIGSDNVLIDLNLAPEFVHLVGESVWPHAEADVLRKMSFPIFYSGKLTTQVTVADGHYMLLGTTVPAVISEGFRDSILVHLIRADLGRPVGEPIHPVVSEYDPPVSDELKLQNDGMAVSTYLLPPGFFPVNAEEPGRTARSVLEGVGILFPEGASASYDPVYSKLRVRNTPDQLELLEAYIGTGCCRGGEGQVVVITEFIEVPQSMLADWLAGPSENSDGNAFRAEVEAWIDKDSARLLHLSAITARSGQRAKAESVRKYFYGTETESGVAPVDLTLREGATGPVVGPTSTVFETRNLGLTVEVDPVISADGNTIDLNLAPEFVELAGLDDFPSADADPAIRIAMPRFHEMKGTSQVTLSDGSYELLSLAQPLKPSEGMEESVVLIFLRADLSHIESD